MSKEVRAKDVLSCRPATHPVGDTEAPTEFVIDEVADPAALIPPEAGFAVELRRDQRVRPARSQDVSLSSGKAQQDFPFSRDEHAVTGQ